MIKEVLEKDVTIKRLYEYVKDLDKDNKSLITKNKLLENKIKELEMLLESKEFELLQYQEESKRIFKKVSRNQYNCLLQRYKNIMNENLTYLEKYGKL